MCIHSVITYHPPIEAQLTQLPSDWCPVTNALSHCQPMPSQSLSRSCPSANSPQLSCLSAGCHGLESNALPNSGWLSWLLPAPCYCVPSWWSLPTQRLGLAPGAVPSLSNNQNIGVLLILFQLKPGESESESHRVPGSTVLPVLSLSCLWSHLSLS